MKRMRKCGGGYIRLTVIDNIIQKMKNGGMSSKSRRKNDPCSRISSICRLLWTIASCAANTVILENRSARRAFFNFPGPLNHEYSPGKPVGHRQKIAVQPNPPLKRSQTFQYPARTYKECRALRLKEASFKKETPL